MRVLKLVTAAALTVAGGVLGGCQTIGATDVDYERFCTEYGAPPGSPLFAECVALIDEEIALAEREFEQRYTDLRVDYRCTLAFWQDGEPVISCRLVDVRTY